MSEDALLFTDLVDSTRLAERLGAIRSSQLWAEHDRRVRDLLAHHHGREINRTDGFFLLFAEVADAARFALRYHDAMRDLGLQARVGIHLGTVSLRANSANDIAHGARPFEVEGLSIAFAARIMALARGGQTLVSADARAALDAAVEEAEIESHGHYRLKGIETPVEIFELGAQRSCSFTPPQDVDKAYRVVPFGQLWRPLRAIRHNLSAERDGFIGRREELRTLSQRLDAGTRLLTVLGPGGTGKTRLVRHYALAWLGDWSGGVYFCDLSEARSLDAICFALGSALEVPLGKGDPVVQLGHAIAARGRCLVIFDNFEQVVAHASATLEKWIDRGASAVFVVTSRERLHVQGEDTFLIGSLDLDTDAVDLFVARARAQQKDFLVDPANRDAVSEVVRLLDGLPLAIELAAARVTVLSPSQLVERMRDRFKILASVGGFAARQATLRAAIDWSWNLLTPWEQATLAQCSVFEGGFRLEAAEDVLELSQWPSAPPAMDAVQALVDKSLLRTWLPAGHRGFGLDAPYFGMYLSIRDYATQKLTSMTAGMDRAARHRHTLHYARYGTHEAIDALSRHGAAQRRHELALELDNLVAACRWAVSCSDAETAVATFRAIWQVLDLRGPFELVMALGGAVVALAETSHSLCAAALATRAAIARRMGRIEDAGAWLARALELSRSVRDRQSEAIVLGELGSMLSGQGRIEELTYNEQALSIHREIGNRIAEGVTLGHLGNTFCDRGQIEDARRYYESALAIHRETGNRRAEGLVLGNLGTLFSDVGPIAEAHRYFAAALEIAQEIGSRREEGAVLGNLGTLLFAEGCLAEALTNVEASRDIARDVGDRRSEAIAVGNCGDLKLELGRLPEALADLKLALSIAREVGHLRHEGALLGSLANALARQGHVDEANDALREGEALLRKIGDPFDLARLLCLRAQSELRAGTPDAARSTLDQAEKLVETLLIEPDSALGQEIAQLRALLA